MTTENSTRRIFPKAFGIGTPKGIVPTIFYRNESKGNYDHGEFGRTLSRSNSGIKDDHGHRKTIIQKKILSVALLADGQHIVSGDNDGRIRCWRVGDGEEVGTPMGAGSAVRCLLAPQDGKWIVAGTESGRVLVWDAETRQKVNEFTYKKGVSSVDISLDGKKIAIASDDNVADIWSLPDNRWLCGRSDSRFHTVKFSPDGILFAAAVESGGSSFLSIFNSQDGNCLSSIQISVLSVAWASDNRQLFALVSDGNIHCVDGYSPVTLSKWPIHSTNEPRWISISSNGSFIAACANASVSFWDTSTHEQIGLVSHHLHSINCMAISPNYDFVIAGNSNIALWDLLDVFSNPNQKLPTGFQIPETALKDTITKLRSQAADAQRSAKQKEDALEKAVVSLRADLKTQNNKSTDLEKTVKELRIQLSDTQQKHGEEARQSETTIQQLRTQLSEFQQNAKQSSAELTNFQRRCAKSLEKLAEAAFGSQNYDEADRHYSTILSLDVSDRVHTLTERSRTRVMMKSWEDALKDADEVIKLDPSGHRGYEWRHAALHRAKRYAEAAEAFDAMLLKLGESRNPFVRELCFQYPDARYAINAIIEKTTAHMPQVLIDTTTGRLCDRNRLAEAFEELPVFSELVKSTIDEAWIQREVDEFCRYVMFSHKWGRDEPLFAQAKQITVYRLEVSPGNLKLQTFCLLVRCLGFRWAWSDTCCIDKKDNTVLQESLVAMFTWYHGSSLTLIHLLGVSSLSEIPNGIRNSIWNSRVWTYQEYVAAKRVLFYTEDWDPYLGLKLNNHKESSTILREMETSQVSSEQVAVLQPGLNRVREKLYLASMRQTTRVEDMAYSLLGILNASIPVTYGEGPRAVGRLLEYVLTGSGDTTILAWTGTANTHNSCLPVNLAVYNTVVPPHVPHMKTDELDRIVAVLRSSIGSNPLTLTLYDELNKLPSPTLSSSRLRLPCIISCVNVSGPDVRKYRATTDLFSDAEIETASNLNGHFILVHPWIRPLLDQEYARGSTGLDLTTQALRLIARLQQPFGALMFQQVSRTEYRRIAADSLIMVQLRKEVSLTDLMNNIRTIEVL